MRVAASTDLPSWAQVTDDRAAHIARVTALLEEWGTTMRLPPAERDAWRDAGRWHDALRDAPVTELRRLTGDDSSPAGLLHGPAAAARLRSGGEARSDVLGAIEHHTVGSAEWSRTGRALYMADYLEPGRPFARVQRAWLAAQVPHDFEGAFREVVRHRLEWAIREELPFHPHTVALWNAIR